MLPKSLTIWYADFKRRSTVMYHKVEMCDKRRKVGTAERGLCTCCGVYPTAGGHTHTAAAARAAGLCHGCYKKRPVMKQA
jgi:hypothetical protein